MASRPALPKHKVVSSGRLASTGRGQPVKKKAARLSNRPAAAPEPHYSLYSTDSEDQVTTVHRGLDRCAALLHGLLQAEPEESKPSISKGVKSTPAKPKPKTAAARREAERKKPLRKATCPSSAAAMQKTSALAHPVQRGQPYCPEGRQPIAEPGLGSHDPAGPQMGPPLTAAAQWELMQTQARSSVTYQQQSSGASLQAPSPGQLGSTLFNCRLATSTPVLGPNDTPTSQPCASNPMQAPTMTSSLGDTALQQLAQQWLLASAASHGLLPLAPNAQHHPVTMATAQQHPVTMATTNMAAPMAVPNMAASQQHLVTMATTQQLPVTMATSQQQPVFSSMPESLCHLTPVTSASSTASGNNMSAPMAPSNMSIPMYTHHSAAAPPQQPQLPQHGSLAPGRGALPDHPLPSNPSITISTVSTTGSEPSHNNPHVKQNGVGNPHSDSRAHKLYATTLPSSAAAQASQDAPGQVVANQLQPQPGSRSTSRTPLDGSAYATSSSSSEDEDVDITPVRDSDSQNGSRDSQNGSRDRVMADVLKVKALSPEKTTRKVMTVKYLLGELKTLVANQDSAAVQLINEVENSISLLPSMVGTTNIQAELALALQPLRSENAQLRRRLRILNQQLMERERAEREARPVDCDMEMTSLQSLNLSLQLQLREAHKETEQIQLEKKELRQAVEDKQSQLQLSRQQSEAETSRIMMDVSDALSEMRSCQSQLESSMMENAALSTSLQQREAEICRLQQVIRGLHGRLSACSTEHLDAVATVAVPDVSKSDPNPNPQLRKKLLQEQEQQQRTSQRGSDASVSTSVHNYLQSLEQRRLLSATISPPRSHHSPPKSPTRPPWRPGDPWGGSGGSGSSSLPLERSHSPRRQGTTGAGTDFAPMKTSAVAQDDDPYSRPLSSARSERSLDGSSALRSLSQIMERLASVSARGGTPSENFHKVYKPFHHDNTGAPAAFSSVTVPRATTPPRTCKQVAMGTGAMVTAARPAVTFTGRPSVVNSSLASSPESLASNSSFSSVSTFNTRDEEILRTGMDTLDATIARLQRTLEIDLKR